VTGWFGMLGAPIGDAESGLVRQYLGALGIDEALPIEAVHDWPSARNVATSPAWDRRWWDAEQRERQRLYSRILKVLPEEGVLRLLSSTLDSDGAVRDAAARAAGLACCTDAGLVRAAAGAASEAFYLAELARLASANHEHPFRLKEALFAGGRWPLGILAGRYWLF
jgi:hypothetical protein